MSNIIKKASGGCRRQIQTLYKSNCQKAYYVAKCLLSSEEEAANATAYAFNTSFDIIRGNVIATEQEFTQLVIRHTVDFCKRKILKTNSKAFKLPQERNFLIAANPVPNDSKDILGEILCILPPLQRFIFVLHTVAEYNSEQIANIFKFDVKTVEIALNAEQKNICNILKTQEAEKQSFEYAQQLIKENLTKTQVSGLADKKVEDIVDRICLPIEKKKRNITLICTALVLCLCIIVGVCCISGNYSYTSTTAGGESSDASESDSAESEEVYLDTSLTYYADIVIQDYGTVTVKLEPDDAPITCANFVDLANQGFYDGLTFHRIIEDFMMQGGDPNGDGTGGSENTIVGEFTDNGYDNELSHTRGAISMARSSDYDSASSQFFIVHEDSTYLDGQYAVFGYVTDGLDVVDQICESAEPTDDNGTITAAEQPIITAVSIRTE